MKKKNRLIWLTFLGLVASILACNAPTPTPQEPHLSPSSPPQETVSPPPIETLPGSTATNTPSPSTATPTPTATTTPTVTPTQPPPGEPLVILDPGFEIADWQSLPETGEWEGHLRAIFTGGAPPYTFALENNPSQNENYLYIRWRKCKDAPLTLHVWSGDGQEAHKGIWIVSPWCPD